MGRHQQQDTFGFRVTNEERALISGVARRLDRTESAALRLIVREVARELGVTPQTAPPQVSDRSVHGGDVGSNRAA